MIVVTNELLANEPLENRIKSLLEIKPNAIILREKHLDENAYFEKAKSICNLTKDTTTKLFVAHYIEIAKKLNIKNIHLSHKEFMENYQNLKCFDCVSVSVHSLCEAKQATLLGATNLVTGHIFATDCKKGVEPRGLAFLKAVTDSTNIPVWAIGGISLQNYKSSIQNGADDFCLMSTAMNQKIEKLNEINRYNTIFSR